MTKEQLDEILRKHKKWLNGEEGGERADLSGIDLSGFNLSFTDLRGAIMVNTNMRGAVMVGTDLSLANMSESIMIGTNMSSAIMRGTDLRVADMRGANLSGAIMTGAIMTGVIMSEAILEDVKFNEYTSFFAMTCPEEGPFIGFKKCSGYIVKLLILEDAKRSSATSRKCRCDKAKVLSITNLYGSGSGITKIESDYDKNFVYEVGKTVFVEDFDDDRWNECSTGIHFFITREEAINY